MTAHAEALAILNQRIDDSSALLNKQQRRGRLRDKIETVVLFVVLFIFIAALKYIFWGGGFKLISPAHHDHTVSALIGMPGPQGELMLERIKQEGHISYVKYGAYVEMANTHKRELEQASAKAK